MNGINETHSIKPKVDFQNKTDDFSKFSKRVSTVSVTQMLLNMASAKYRVPC